MHPRILSPNVIKEYHLWIDISGVNLLVGFFKASLLNHQKHWIKMYCADQDGLFISQGIMINNYAFKIVLATLFWLGQMKICITVINKYIVFMHDRFVKQILIIAFALFMTIFPIVLFARYHHNDIIMQILTLHPRRFVAIVLLLYFLFGVLLFIRANIISLVRKLRRPFPPRIRLLERVRLIHPDAPKWTPPRIPLGLGRFLNSFNNYYQLEKSIYEIQSDNLPDDFDGLRVVHLTDFHFDGSLVDEYYDFCIREANALNPHIILVTGDNISAGDYTKQAVKKLSELQAAEGVFFLRGNHDFWTDGKGFLAEMKKKRCVVLDNKAIHIKKGKAQIRIYGVEHPWKRDIIWDNLLRDKRDIFTICATHTPDNFRRAADAGAALTLCGHTHGGQIRLPFFGPLICPSRYNRTYDQGFFERNGGLLYINRGIGSTVPFRFRCLPEIALFILKKTLTVP